MRDEVEWDDDERDDVMIMSLDMTCRVITIVMGYVTGIPILPGR